MTDFFLLSLRGMSLIFGFTHLHTGKKKKKNTIHSETGSFQWGSERHVLFLKRQQGCCGVDDLIAAALDALMAAIKAE